MTYLEKVMLGIKIDKEIFTEKHAQVLEATIKSAILESTCPGRFLSIVPSAGKRACSKTTCEDCWNREAR